MFYGSIIDPNRNENVIVVSLEFSVFGSRKKFTLGFISLMKSTSLFCNRTSVDWRCFPEVREKEKHRFEGMKLNGEWQAKQKWKCWSKEVVWILHHFLFIVKDEVHLPSFSLLNDEKRGGKYSITSSSFLFSFYLKYSFHHHSVFSTWNLPLLFFKSWFSTITRGEEPKSSLKQENMVERGWNWEGMKESSRKD